MLRTPNVRTTTFRVKYPGENKVGTGAIYSISSALTSVSKMINDPKQKLI